jgi:hypothetical protein
MISCKLCEAADGSTLPPRGPRTFHLPALWLGVRA